MNKSGSLSWDQIELKNQIESPFHTVVITFINSTSQAASIDESYAHFAPLALVSELNELNR